MSWTEFWTVVLCLAALAGPTLLLVVLWVVG